MWHERGGIGGGGFGIGVAIVNNKTTWTVGCRRGDLEAVQKAVDVFNDTRALKELDKKIAAFEKIGNLKPEELRDYVSCVRQHSNIIKGDGKDKAPLKTHTRTGT